MSNTINLQESEITKLNKSIIEEKERITGGFLNKIKELIFEIEELEERLETSEEVSEKLRIQNKRKNTTIRKHQDILSKQNSKLINESQDKKFKELSNKTVILKNRIKTLEEIKHKLINQRDSIILKTLKNKGENLRKKPKIKIL